uniref:Uncharacterized protein n=1 Tax=viral metagenome TaxID=1070528 RepID=A0A6C0FHW5_9ZZZZ
MPCSICRQSGHNRSTCPQRRTNQSHSQSHTHTLFSLPIQYTPRAPLSNPPRRRAELSKFRNSVKNVINFQRFVKSVYIKDSIKEEDIRIVYRHWLRVKNLKGHLSDSTDSSWLRDIYYLPRSKYYSSDDYPDSNKCHSIFSMIKNSCLIYHMQNTTETPQIKDDKRLVKLFNLKSENYLIYWVMGNYMVEDIDSRVNAISYMGILPKGGSFKLKTMIGHRFYLVPHKFNYEPPYHPRTDKEFFIDPYVQINIHDKTGENIHIDEKDSLSELNKWKFNALKLDYLIREMIKLGAKNNDVLECILDLHEDIKLDDVSEVEKDIAGIPSTMTNIT